MPDRSLGLEWALLELLTLGLSTPEEQAGFAELINSPNLDWDEVWAQASRHKILSILVFYGTSRQFKTAGSRTFSDIDLSKNDRV